METKPEQVYDYIVVGGGTAGSVVAARLAENPDLTVCLVEAGPTDEGNAEVLAIKNWPNLLGTALDYDYRIEQQERGNSAIRHSRGRVLGGCSSHNSCIAFSAPDYDLDMWQQLGCEGWSARDTRKYFDAVFEKVYIEKDPTINPVSQAFLDAAQEAGFRLITFNEDGALREGVGKLHLNAQDGRRQSSSQAYLHPILKTATNLTVHTNSCVNKLLLDEQNGAYAVETDSGVLLANREIVLCCGTFDTPKLLLLSGIGPRQHLEQLGIAVRVEVLGVGEHLIDHPEGVIIWEAKQAVPEETTQYWEVGLFSKVFPASPLPDIMFHFGVVPFDWNTLPLGYPTAPHGFSMTPNVPRARSEGFVKLRSSNAKDAPVINFRYFSDAEGYDETILLEGLNLARTIAAQPALKRWIKRELAPGIAVQSDQELSEYARRTANTVYHPAGTCKMGAKADRLAVVDAELRVRDVNRLRVADASIFPTMVSVNPCMTCMMIGEKCADLIRHE
ncbi:MAG: GMC family oxidoreductase N-terminal domain-containing protein [Ktedonobacteraceae bacterium]